MRWIKKYENFSVSIKDDIDDIFLELTDSDNKWNISLLNEYNYDKCTITPTIPLKYPEEDIDVMIDYLAGSSGVRSSFKIEDNLLECIYRLVEYMKSIGYYATIWARNKTYERSVNLEIKHNREGKISVNGVVIEPNGYRYSQPYGSTYVSVIQLKFRKNL